MAEDAIVLLDTIGWTADRDIHVVGVSMGGMISQGLGVRVLILSRTDSSPHLQSSQHAFRNELRL
jgi:pimeloyl-ACP methyl ester carboxylesterase